MPSSDKHRERPRTTVKAKISKPRSAGVEEEMESPQAMYQRRRNEATAVTSPNRPTTSSGGGGRGVQTAMTTSPQPHQNTAAQQQSSSVATTPQQQKMPTKSILKKKPQEQNGNPPWRLIIVGNEKIRKLFRESGFVSGANSEAKHIELQRQSRRRTLPTDWDDEIQSLSDDTEAQQHEESLLPALVDIPPEQETSEEDDQSTESQPMEDQEGELEEEIAEGPSPDMGHEESDDIPSGDEEKEEPVDVQRPEIGQVQQRENEVPGDEDDQSSLGDEQIPNMRLLEDLDIDEEDDIEDITANYHINPEPMALNNNIEFATAEAQEAHSREEMRHSYDAEPPPRQQQRRQQLVLDEQPSCSYAVPPPLSEKEQIRRRACDLLGISYFDKIVTDESKEVIMNRLMGLLQNGPDFSEQASYVVSNDADESRSVGSGSHRDDMASPENELLQDADAQEEEMPADDDGHVQAQSPEPQDETDHQPDDDPQDQAVQQPADVDLFDGPIAAVEAPFPDVAEIEDDDDDEVMEEEENTSDNEVIVRLPKRKPIKRECPPEVEPCVVGTKSGHRAAQEHAQAGAGLELVRQQQNFKEQSQQASAFPMEQQQPQQHYAPWPQSVASQVENQQRQQQREDFVSQTNSNGGGGHQDEDLDETAELLEQPLQQKRREALQKFFKERQIQAPNVNERGIATANASLAPPGQQQQHSLSPSPVPPPQPPPPPMAAPLPPPPPPPPDQQPNPIPAGIRSPTSSNAEPQDHRQLDGLWRKRKRPSRRDKVERRKHRERETDQHNVPDTQREKSNTPDAYRQSSRSSKRSDTRSPSGSSRRTWSPSPAPSQASSNNERSANRAPVATSTFVRTAPAPKCKFYNPNQPISSCRDGERCLFFHDRSHPTRSVEIQKMGRKPGDQWPPRLWNCVHYFGKGDCRSGYNCPFSHGDEPTIGSERLREMDARINQRLQREENSSRKSSIEDELVLTETLNSDSQSPKPAEKVQQIVAPRIPPPPPNIVDNEGGGGTGPSGSTTTLMSRSNIVRTSGQPTPSAAESYVQNVSAFAIPAAHQKKNKPAFAARVQAQEDPLPFFLTAEKSGFKPVLHVADDLELTDSVRSNSPTPSPVPPPHPPQNPVLSSQARQMQLQNGQQPFEASEKENRSVEGSSIQSTSRQRSRSRTRSRSPIRDRRHSRRTRSRVRQRSRSRSRSRSRERRNSRARSLNRGGHHSPPSGHSHSRSSMHRRRRSRTRSRSRSADNSSRRSPQGDLPSQEQMFRKKFHRSPIRKNPKKTKYPPNFKSFTAPGILKYVDDCPFYAWHGFCNYDERCKYSHGDANKTYGYCKAESKVASQNQCRRVFGYDTNMSDEGVGVPPPIIELD